MLNSKCEIKKVEYFVTLPLSNLHCISINIMQVSSVRTAAGNLPIGTFIQLKQQELDPAEDGGRRGV